MASGGWRVASGKWQVAGGYEDGDDRGVRIRLGLGSGRRPPVGSVWIAWSSNACWAIAHNWHLSIMGDPVPFEINNERDWHRFKFGKDAHIRFD